MRVLVDDNPCDVAATSVGEAIAVGAAIAENRGRLIVEVVVDGEAWSGERLGSDDGAGADEVRLTTADPIELVAQTFEDASTALMQADRLQQSAADLVRGDDLPAAMAQLGEAVEIWRSVQQAVVMGTELAGIDLEHGRISQAAAACAGSSFSEIIETLNSQLRGVRDALTARDTAALSDSLLYELPAVVQQWRALLDDLTHQVQARTK